MTALPKDMVEIAIKGGASTRAEVKSPARFKAGDKVVARNINPATHTRLPRYIRGKHGVVQGNHGGFVFADTRAHGLGDQPHHVYSASYGALTPRRMTRSISTFGNPTSSRQPETMTDAPPVPSDLVAAEALLRPSGQPGLRRALDGAGLRLRDPAEPPRPLQLERMGRGVQ